MGFLLGMGSPAMCTFGVAPGPLTFLPAMMILGTSGPLGNIMDMAPFENISPFGVCITPSNPMTAALTAAALGVLTPAPCIPVPAGPWVPINPMIVCNLGPMLNIGSMLMCAWGGMIRPVMSPQVTVVM